MNTELKNYLEELMDLRRTCTIRFRADNDAVSTLQTRIMELYEREGKLNVKLEQGLEIKQDRIISVNGRHFETLS